MRYWFLFILLISSAVQSVSQSTQGEKIPVELKLPFMQTVELEIIYKEGEAYIPADTFFLAVGIKSSFNLNDRKLRGFIRDPDSSFIVDITQGQARYKDESVILNQRDYIFLDNVLYLRIGFLNSLLPYRVKYNPRTVAIEVKNAQNLPAVISTKLHRSFIRAAERRKLPPPEAVLERFGGYGGTRIDYFFNSYLIHKNSPRTQYNTSIGTKLFNSDITMRLYGNLYSRRSDNNTRGQIRYPFLNSSIVRQIIGGDYITNGVLPNQLFGVELTNRPAPQRYMFTREVFHGQFEPSSDIVLFGGAEGVQTYAADESGNYRFDAPVVYGQGSMEVHAFDYFGQEQILRYRMNVPTTVLPPGEVEYSISAGKMHTLIKHYASSNYFNWGVSPFLTIGAKFDYFDFSTPMRAVSALTATSRLTSALSFNGLVAPSALSRGSISWIFPSNASINLIGTHFERSSYFNPAQIKDNTNLTLLFPIKMQNSILSVQASADLTNSVFNHERQIQVSVGYPFNSFSPRLSEIITWRDSLNGNYFKTQQLTLLSFGVSLPAGFVFQSDITYNHLSENIESISSRVLKSLSGRFNFFLTYFRIPALSYNVLGLQLHYLLPFVDLEAGVTKPNFSDNYTYSTSIRGSAGYDPISGYAYFDNQPIYTGYGALRVQPFIDANANGIKDVGEEKVSKANILLSNVTRNGQPVNVQSGFSTRRLLSYEQYDVYLDPQSMEDPLLVPVHGTVRFLSEPNTLRTILIPVVTGGSVHGQIVAVSKGIGQPIEGINVKLYSVGNGKAKGNKIFKTTSTFSTGEYEFTLLPPGEYVIEPDMDQLQKLGYQCEPGNREIEITLKADGDIVEKIDFKLTVK
jgi:hypothetical protein